MTAKEYLEAKNNFYKLENEIHKYNRELCDKYPWLIPTNRWSGKRITDCYNNMEKGYWPGNPDEIPEYHYEYTELDAMPEGWRIAFGEQMCEEIQAELEKFDYVDKYRIEQIKSKFASLRWYDAGSPIGTLSETYEIIEKDDWKYPDYDRDTECLIAKGQKGDKYIFHKYKILDRCKIHDIINKYENLSYITCEWCGKQAAYISEGWIDPYCEECAKPMIEKGERMIPIKEFYHDL